MNDLLHVFMFEHMPVRGALVQLEATWRFMRGLRAHPPAVDGLLGEAVVACALLASTLKDGSENVLLQMQGDGPVSLLVAECSSDLGLRCTARYTDLGEHVTVPRLFGNGRCAITVSSASTARRYQGVVPLEEPTLAGVLQGYMDRSEQLPTSVVLHASAEAAGGLLLQRIPDRVNPDPDGWNRVRHLGATVTGEELRQLDAPTLLRRLFPEEDVRLFGGRSLRFRCTCSKERVVGMLRSLGRTEVEAVIAEQGQVEVTCEFCGQRYTFDADESRALF